MADAAPTITPVTTHYDALLAARYTWMMGGLDGCLSSARALLDAVGLYRRREWCGTRSRCWRGAITRVYGEPGVHCYCRRLRATRC